MYLLFPYVYLVEVRLLNPVMKVLYLVVDLRSSRGISALLEGSSSHLLFLWAINNKLEIQLVNKLFVS